MAGIRLGATSMTGLKAWPGAGTAATRRTGATAAKTPPEVVPEVMPEASRFCSSPLRPSSLWPAGLSSCDSL